MVGGLDSNNRWRKKDFFLYLVYLLIFHSILASGLCGIVVAQNLGSNNGILQDKVVVESHTSACKSTKDLSMPSSLHSSCN
jgi:hypothetical protein